MWLHGAHVYSILHGSYTVYLCVWPSPPPWWYMPYIPYRGWSCASGNVGPTSWPDVSINHANIKTTLKPLERERESRAWGTRTLGWVNMYQICDFSTFSYLGKLIYLQKFWNKQIFAVPCKNSQQKLNFLALRRHKTIQDRDPIWSKVEVLQNINSQYPLTNLLFLNYYTSKILIFIFLQMCQKCPNK